jgi:hypothetical protein
VEARAEHEERAEGEPGDEASKDQRGEASQRGVVARPAAASTGESLRGGRICARTGLNLATSAAGLGALPSAHNIVRDRFSARGESSRTARYLDLRRVGGALREDRALAIGGRAAMHEAECRLGYQWI